MSIFTIYPETHIGNSCPPYAVRLQMPAGFTKPYTSQEWFDSLPIPPYWFDEKVIPKEIQAIEYLIHPLKWERNLKEASYTSKEPIIKWHDKLPFWYSCIDIIDNDVNEDFIHPRFTRVLKDVGLEIAHWDIFITPANMWLGAHKDAWQQSTKLNFVYCFKQDGLSQQNYFIIDESTKDNVPGDHDVKYYIVKEVALSDGPNSPRMVHQHNLSFDLTQPSLTNIGIYHNVVNTTSGPRVCLSYSLKLIGKDSIGRWDEVYPRLQHLQIN
ncbi:hypothetical protein EBU71_00185 [bacterium]|nr:hypothetical protein [Candidatus Elulimicrobium humile]